MQTQQNDDVGRKSLRDEPVKLRGHHFLCLLTYKGLGYTPGFVENMSVIVAGIAEGRAVVLVEGADDICDALSADDRRACDHDCLKLETRQIDQQALEAVHLILDVDMNRPFQMRPETVARLRAEFVSGSIRTACARCRWKTICDDIAANDFAGTKLFQAG